jgi:hypothetical protein
MKPAVEMVTQAKGKYVSQYITQTNSLATPIIDRLSPEEQLHFVFFHSDKGFRITEPDGEKKTPDHTSLSDAEGKRFLLITDERILYIVGQPEEEDDKVQEFDYDQITSVEAYKSMRFPTIEFTTNDGRTYKFVNHANKSDSEQNVADCIRTQIRQIGSQTSEESSQEETTSYSEVRFCPDCGSEIKATDTFCSECGNDVGQIGSNGNQIENSDQNTTDSSQDEGVKWTLSLVIAVLMSIISGILAVLYTIDGNIVSGGFLQRHFSSVMVITPVILICQNGSQ